ncbi:isochorismatase family cysteine hydrolase [Flavobacterium defluvii]|uniref:Nicotinamidase-related amidase n=1 Tax=Flavobacterium defluvii TaxID=370979 RepID=A0A1M5ITR9_9FLAO|nr:isochorismatase family cysteine hydrolase [Flavobacterium defluvii]SHG31656.1 Nicotinamidase-related amidase [Flavobacterium defluvii]
MDTNNYSKTALILVDPFNDFLSEGGKLYHAAKETVEGISLVQNLKKLIEGARERKIQIIYAPHHHTAKGDYLNWKFLSPSHKGSKNVVLFEENSWGAEFHPELQPQSGDLIAQNHWTASGFANTDLDFLLRIHNIDHIMIAGMRANTCIDSTARYGVELGYHVTLIKDGIGAFNWEEIRVTVEITFPNYGHAMLTTEEFINTPK